MTDYEMQSVSRNAQVQKCLQQARRRYGIKSDNPDPAITCPTLPPSPITLSASSGSSTYSPPDKKQKTGKQEEIYVVDPMAI